MAKSAHNDVLDSALNIIKNNCTHMILCSAQPTSRTEAVTTYALATQAMVSGDFTIGTGDASGRKCAVAGKNAISVASSGTGNHVALVDGTRLLWVTTCNSQAVTAGNTVNIPTWDIEIASPV